MAYIGTTIQHHRFFIEPEKIGDELEIADGDSTTVEYFSFQQPGSHRATSFIICQILSGR